MPAPNPSSRGTAAVQGAGLSGMMLDMRLSTRQVPPRLVALSFGMTEDML